MKKVIFLHGTCGDGQENWFPWLREALMKKGYDVQTPVFPTPEGQSLEVWKEVFYREVGPLSDDMILVGHSSGSTLMLHLLQESKEAVAQSLFVSLPIYDDGKSEFSPLVKTFINQSFDWGKIRKNMGKAAFFHGDDDPYVPLEQPLEAAKALGYPVSVFKDGGHLNEAAGFLEFPELLDCFE